MENTRVLIVDDHAILRDGLKIALSTEPTIKVIGEADCGEKAVQLAKELKPDVIVMDIDLPTINGIEAVTRIRKFDKDIKILMLTMHENESYIFDAVSAEIDGYLFKMTDMEIFIEAIKNVASGHKYFDSKVSQVLIKNYNAERSGFQKNDKDDEIPLTKREIEILKLISAGFTTNDIAEQLFISFFTVSKHRKNIMKKIGVKNSAELVKWAFEKKIIV